MDRVSISLITVTLNAADTIERCIRSVISQKYTNLQYIIIDAQSADATMALIETYYEYVDHLVSEPDNGIYHAMNKGIALATGDIVGILNADDYFADNQVLNDISDIFTSTNAAIIYGDIDYVNKHGHVVRKWRSRIFTSNDFNRGWMPPHPSFYVKRELFKRFGLYNPEYGSATDYELMLRFMYGTDVKVQYLNKVMVKMQIGGISNKNIVGRFKAWYNDFRAMRTNRLNFPYLVVILKPLRKVFQYFTLL